VTTQQAAWNSKFKKLLTDKNRKRRLKKKLPYIYRRVMQEKKQGSSYRY
jgi:hypothetical protein